MRTVIAALFLCAFTMTASATMRESLGDTRAAAVDAAFAAALPGATLQWDETLTVTLPDGARSAVRIIGPEPFGTMWVMHVELDDFARAAVEHARTFSKEPAPTRLTDFLAAVPASGTPRIARLDPTSISIEVKAFDVIPEYEVPQTWPGVSVTYWATYATPDWAGSVRWTGAYNLQTRSDQSRMPVGIAKKRASGDGVAEQVSPTRVSDELVQIEGGQTRQRVQYLCPFPCTFDGKSLLAAWAVVPTPLAAN